MKNIKAKGSWASYYRDKKDKNLWRCNVDEMAEIIVNGGWGNMPKILNNKKAMEVCLLAEAYLNLRDKK